MGKDRKTWLSQVEDLNAKIREVRELARAKCPRAIERLGELVESKDERVAHAAAESLLARGFGKPGLMPTPEVAMAAERARQLRLQNKKLEAEVEALKKVADGVAGGLIPIVPGTKDYEEMLLREWGYARSGTKAKESNGHNGHGTNGSGGSSPPTN